MKRYIIKDLTTDHYFAGFVSHHPGHMRQGYEVPEWGRRALVMNGVQCVEAMDRFQDYPSLARFELIESPA